MEAIKGWLSNQAQLINTLFRPPVDIFDIDKYKEPKPFLDPSEYEDDGSDSLFKDMSI